MAFGRWFVALACLSVASGAQAIVPTSHAPARLALNLAALGIDTNVTYKPVHWIASRVRTLFVNVARGTTAPRAAQDRPRLRSYAMTGDVHPFGDGLRITGGFREDGNRQLLHTSTETEQSTRQYSPVVTVGYAEEAAPGLTLGADVGMLLPGMSGARDSILVMPTDMTAKSSSPGRTPLVQLSAGYRF